MLYKTTALVALFGTAHGAAAPAESSSASGDTCYDLKLAYKNSECCTSNLGQATDYTVTSMKQPTIKAGENICEGAKVTLENDDCMKDGVVAALEQAGTNVTLGYVGSRQTDKDPITTTYLEAGLCPVNVHWHLGTEHLSVGEYDENGSGPGSSRRRLAEGARQGFQCHHYDSSKEKFTKPYEWKHCVGMEVGQTYEVHWPHSIAGDCGTPNQYQTPFYDGVFCHFDKLNLATLPQHVAVQAQIFTIVNDDEHYYPDLMRGMIIDGDMGKDITKYTGSTTGTTRNNDICSSYTPITWQVDRKCHLISASAFDKMCADMKTQRDDMSDDLYAHGARELVSDHLAANNHQRKLDAK